MGVTFKRRFSRHPLALTPETAERWLVRSRPPVNRQEARPQGSSWPPRLPGSLRHPPEVSRSPIATGPAQSLSVRSGVTRSPPSCSSASCGSSPPPSVPCRRLARPTWLVCLRTPTCAPSTPSVSPSCPRTSSWPGGSVESVHKKDHSGLTWQSLTTLGTPCGPSVTAHPSPVFSKILKSLCFDISLHFHISTQPTKCET